MTNQQPHSEQNSEFELVELPGSERTPSREFHAASATAMSGAQEISATVVLRRRAEPTAEDLAAGCSLEELSEKFGADP